mgnify:CR=1 FL=1
MGLDITHYKATLQRPEELHPVSNNYIIEESFDEWGFDSDFNHFSAYIQFIDHPVSLQTIIFPRKDSDPEKVKYWLSTYEYPVFFFDKETADMETILEEYLETNGLAGNQVRRWDTEQWIGFQVFYYEQVPGFYFQEVGYQRKGMNETFWTRFGSEDTYCFLKKEDVEFAYTCVDYYWDDDTEEEVIVRKQLFLENFVTNFEPGKSWMSLSY